MKTLRSRILLITLLALGSILSLLPRSVTERTLDPATGQMVEHTTRRIPIDLGLDLSGGVHLALELHPSEARVDDCADAIDGAARVIRNRISEFGTTSPVVQTAADGSSSSCPASSARESRGLGDRFLTLFPILNQSINLV